MNDNWSLKGRLRWGYDSLGQPLIRMDKISQAKVLMYDDIDLLRQKLIEDMEEAWSKLCADENKLKYRFIKYWRDSINKRFGVEEDG